MTKEKMIKHIIFDFGGVFLDLGGNHSGIPNDLSELFGINVAEIYPVWNENKKNLLTGRQKPIEFLYFFAKHFGLEVEINEKLKKWEQINILPRERIDWQLVDLLAKLKKNYQVHLLTDQIDVNSGLDQYKDEISIHFDNIFRSYNEGLSKPESQAYLNALKKIPAQPQECIFIDDSKANIQASQDLGIDSILYQFGNVENLEIEFNSKGIKI